MLAWDSFFHLKPDPTLRWRKQDSKLQFRVRVMTVSAMRADGFQTPARASPGSLDSPPQEIGFELFRPSRELGPLKREPLQR